jgi:glycosyltransferase involved in cell wall biosynthesis
VLHVLGSLNRGGIEIWLLQALRAVDRRAVQMDFYCLSGDEGSLAPEALALGSRVFVGARGRRGLGRPFSGVLRAGRYDVVHSHVHFFSGYVLRVAAKHGVPGRIAHSHTTEQERPALVRRRYLSVMRKWIEDHATLGLGVSDEAMAALFGPGWRDRDDRRVLYWGLDLERFRQAPAADLRERLGIPTTDRVVGHVGRLDAVKNHRFMLDIAEEMERSGNPVWFLFVGDGSLRRELQQLVRNKGLRRVVFAGEVEEVAPFLQVMDAFLFPSLWEGLPQAVIEAQAAGLRCLCSDVVTREVAVLPDAVEFLSLDSSAREWAGVLGDLVAGPPLDRDDALARVAAGPFEITRSVHELTAIYRHGR